jgi:hypothetical protein
MIVFGITTVFTAVRVTRQPSPRSRVKERAEASIPLMPTAQQLQALAHKHDSTVDVTARLWQACSMMGPDALLDDPAGVATLCLEFGFNRLFREEDLFNVRYQKTRRGRGDNDRIVIFQFSATEHHDAVPAAMPASVEHYANVQGYRHVRFTNCPYMTHESQFGAMARGLALAPADARHADVPLDVFMQRVLAVEYLLLSDPSIEYVMQLDLDVCIRDASHTVASILRQAHALPRADSDSAADGGNKAACALIADTTGESAAVNAGVWLMKRGDAAFELLQEWRSSYQVIGKAWNGDQGLLMNAILRRAGAALGEGALHEQHYDDSCRTDACAGRWLSKFGLGKEPGRWSFGGICLFDQTDPAQRRAIGNIHDRCSVRAGGCEYQPGDFLRHSKHESCPA